MEFSSDEKVDVFDKIAKNYFVRNFGSMSKADFETLLFSEYIEHCIKTGLAYDDYSLSKELGITQSRVRSLKERKELKYPYKDFKWQNAFAESVNKAKYDTSDHYVKMIIQDINVMNEVRNYIETAGWYDECSLNKKLLRIPLDCFVEICYTDETFSDVFTEETKQNVKKISNVEDTNVQAFLKDFTKDGLKSFLMSASKTVICEVLQLLPFGGVAKKAFETLTKVIEEK